VGKPVGIPATKKLESMKKSILNSLLCLGCAASLFSCSKDDNASGIVSDPSTIRFESQVISTKAGPVAGPTFTPGENVGIFALQHATGTPATWTTTPFMANVVSTVGADGKSLTYSPLMNYPTVDEVDFYAYYPQSAAAVSDATGLSLPVTLASTAATQVDYMFATPVMNKVKPATATAIAFTFKHALAQVKFNVQKDNSVTDVINLTNLSVTANTTGTMNIADGVWSTVTTPADLEVYNDAVGTGVAIADVATGGTVVGAPLMIFPSLPTALTFKVTIAGSTYSFTPSIPAAGLEAGKIYTYTLKYNGSAIVFTTATVEPWVDAAALEPINITN